jgi:hypothetical protein
MVTVPPEIVFTTPPGLTVAIDGSLVLQVPPNESLDRESGCPAHNVLIPTIGAGKEFTVISLLVEHPAGKVKIMVAVSCGDTPVTTPEVESTTTTKESVDVQNPVPEGSIRVSFMPGQAVDGPVIGNGKDTTVNGLVI